MILIICGLGVQGYVVIRFGTVAAMRLRRGADAFANLLQRVLDAINIFEHLADLLLSRIAIRVLALLIVRGFVGLSKVEDSARVQGNLDTIRFWSINSWFTLAYTAKSLLVVPGLVLSGRQASVVGRSVV